MNSEDVRSFCDGLSAHLDTLGVDFVALEQDSGVKMPLSRAMIGLGHELQDWETLCYLCFWLRLKYGWIPLEFFTRVVLGPSNRWARFLLRSGVESPMYDAGVVAFFDLAG